MIPVPVAMSYTAKVKGRQLKLVTCEQCSEEYVYALERAAQAEDTSILFLDNAGAKARAEAAARAKLNAKLERECDVVPCPACGHIQPDMVKQARRLRHRWMGMGALTLLPVSAFLFIGVMLVSSGQPSANPLVPLIVYAACAISALSIPGLPILRFILASSYDPNAQDPEALKATGRSRALSADELAELTYG